MRNFVVIEEFKFLTMERPIVKVRRIFRYKIMAKLYIWLMYSSVEPGWYLYHRVRLIEGAICKLK